jgi:hypothetical protein
MDIDAATLVKEVTVDGAKEQAMAGREKWKKRTDSRGMLLRLQMRGAYEEGLSLGEEE